MTVLESGGILELPETGELYLEARCNCFGLRYGERAVFDINGPEVRQGIEKMLLLLVGEDGTVPDPPPPKPSPCGCGH